MCEREMRVTADKTYIKINPLLTLVPLQNGLNTKFEPFFLFVLKSASTRISPEFPSESQNLARIRPFYAII